MTRMSRRNVGEQEYVPRNALAAVALVAMLVVWLQVHFAGSGTVGLVLAFLAAYFFLTARGEFDPVYALLRIRTVRAKPMTPAAS